MFLFTFATRTRSTITRFACLVKSRYLAHCTLLRLYVPSVTDEGMCMGHWLNDGDKGKSN
jgi:hypothetical protein